VFAPLTQSRLAAALKGYLPSACLGLLLTGLAAGGEGVAGGTLSLMGLALGVMGGLPFGRWLAGRPRAEADYRLPLLCGCLALPLAVIPAYPDMLEEFTFGFHGWTSVAAGVALALPLGVCLGSAWTLWGAGGREVQVHRWRYSGLGACLGLAAAGAAGLGLNAFLGSFLVNLVAAPMIWPTLPAGGARSLLARMLLTLVVVVSAMFLLFL
jgi:hypothetical protein